MAVPWFSLRLPSAHLGAPDHERGETPAFPTRYPCSTQPAVPGSRRCRPRPRCPSRTGRRIRRPPSPGRAGPHRARGGRRATRLHHPIGQLGQDRRVRERRRLEHQHRQWLLRRTAVQPHHLAQLRRPRPAPPSQQSHADRHRREGPRQAGLGRLASLLAQDRPPLTQLLLPSPSPDRRPDPTARHPPTTRVARHAHDDPALARRLVSRRRTTQPGRPAIPAGCAPAVRLAPEISMRICQRPNRHRSPVTSRSSATTPPTRGPTPR